MKFAEVAENTKKLVACPPSQDEFIYELLLAAIEAMKSAKAVKANDPRFLIVTDFARIYRSRPFTFDEERLEFLFKLYEEMVAREKLI